MRRTHQVAWTFAIFLIAALVLFSMPTRSYWQEAPGAFHIPQKKEDSPPLFVLPLHQDVKLDNYFGYMDSLISFYDTLVSYQLSEYLLVHANPWIMDTLAGTDYYTKKKEGIFVHDSRKLTVLSPKDTIYIPSKKVAEQIQAHIDSLSIDVNIPEFKLRIMKDTAVLYTFPVRVGQVRERYLAMAGHDVDLRTRRGRGKIVRVNKNPLFINPVDNERYEDTKRDDGRTTEFPVVPWIEPEVNGVRHGQLIHPTTNPRSLGKAYSNGCIGTSEKAAWLIYYHAPLGTPVNIRYELMLIDEVSGDTMVLKDIYHLLDESA